MKATCLTSGAAGVGLIALVLAIGPQTFSAQAQVSGVRCESSNNQYQECQYFADGMVRLSRQLSDSPCVQGRTWDYDSNRRRIWVAQGCRADFIVETQFRGSQAPASGVRCESVDGQYRECQVYADGRVRLARQLSDSPCIEGRTWDYDRNRRSVWVAQGCRADFIVEGGGGFGAAPFAPYGRQPQITTLRNGDTEVGFDSGCTVVFDRSGRRTYYRPNCNGEEVRVADDAMRGGRGQGDFFDGRPEVMMGQGGGEVFFRSNNCVVYYDSRRRRTSSRQECTGSQLRQADQEIANYR